jgi:hypothetical protein
MLAGCECSGLVRDAFAARGWEAWSADILPSETPVRHLSRNLPGSYYVANTEAPEGTHHYQGDVRDLFDSHHPVNFDRAQEWCRAEEDSWTLWDLAILFPPCTHLSLAGARYWKQKRVTRVGPAGEYPWPSVQDEAADFFTEMVDAPAAHVAVENPRGDMTRRYRPPDQYVQPHMFGDPLVKLTGLWLENLPLLHADNPVEPDPAGRVATGGGSYRVDKKKTGLANNAWEDRFGREFRQRERNRTLPGLARAMADQWGAYIEEQHGR